MIPWRRTSPAIPSDGRCPWCLGVAPSPRSAEATSTTQVCVRVHAIDLLPSCSFTHSSLTNERPTTSEPGSWLHAVGHSRCGSTYN
jgi:hypothetical protein